MELLFRKYFWVVNLAFLLCAAFLTAKTVNVFVASKVAPLPDFNSQTVATAPTQQQKATLYPEALSKVTGIELPKPEEKKAEENPTAPQPPPDLDSQEAVRSGLRVKLVGTMVANEKQWSMANIEDVTNHDVKVYMVADHIQGAEIIDIERLRVLINNNGHKEFIDMEVGDGTAAVAPYQPPAVAKAEPPPQNNVGGGIKATGENSYEIPKDEITKALSNLNDIAMQARIVPAFKDGVAVGFKLFSIRPDSLYTKIGVQNGDIIRRINGYEINSPDKALEVYTKLKESNHIEIELDRNGSNVRKQYNVR